MTETYTGRSIERVTITSLNGGGLATTGWSTGLRDELKGKVHVGDVIDFESKGFRCTGVRKDAEWLYRDSDQQLEREHAEMIRNNKVKSLTYLAENYIEWDEAEKALPQWLQGRMATFRTNGGIAYEIDGWGYELAIAQIAAALNELDELPESSYTDTPEAIKSLPAYEGCSGNQYSCALALAKAHRRGESLDHSIAGLSPLTGDAYYEKAGA